MKSKSHLFLLLAGLLYIPSVFGQSQDKVNVTCTLKGIFTDRIASEITISPRGICALDVDLGVCNVDPADLVPPIKLSYLASDLGGRFSPGINVVSPQLGLTSDIFFELNDLVTPSSGDRLRINTALDLFFNLSIPLSVEDRDLILEQAAEIHDKIDFEFSYSKLLEAPFITEVRVPFYSRIQKKLITRRAKVTCTR